MENREITLVVPCRNEAARLKLDEWRSGLEADPRLRLLFVDDGSTDATWEILQSAAAHPRIEVLKLDRNYGKAETVRRGMLAELQHNRSRWIGFWDADLATGLDELENFRRHLTPGCWIVMGSRFRHLGNDIRRRPTRHLLGRIFATLVSWKLRLAVYDTQCGAKVFDREMVGEVFAEPFASRWFFDVEILLRLCRLHGRRSVRRHVIELPLQRWRDVPGSTLRLTDCFFDLIRVLKL